MALLQAMPAAAQSQASAPSKPPFEVYVVGGLNSATMSTPLPEVSIPELSFSQGRLTGFVGGVLLDVPLPAARVAIETGGLLSFKGFTMKASVMDLGSAKVTTKMTYLDVPALVRGDLVRSRSTVVQVLGGATLGLRLSASLRGTVEGVSQTESITSETSTVDLGLTVAGRVAFGRGLAEVRYTHGLLNVATEIGPDDETIKHRVLSFMGGWRF